MAERVEHLRKGGVYVHVEKERDELLEGIEAHRKGRVSSLRAFVRESNRIEGILREPASSEIAAHRVFLGLTHPRRADVENFVRAVAGAPLRDREGMNVVVGPHRPPPGNREMGLWLDDLLEAAFVGADNAWATHVRYEKLHPFMDGNGRSGRVLWAWQMQREGQDPFALPFLHRAYYQALNTSRGTGSEKP